MRIFLVQAPLVFVLPQVLMKCLSQAQKCFTCEHLKDVDSHDCCDIARFLQIQLPTHGCRCDEKIEFYVHSQVLVSFVLSQIDRDLAVQSNINLLSHSVCRLTSGWQRRWFRFTKLNSPLSWCSSEAQGFLPRLLFIVQSSSLQLMTEILMILLAVTRSPTQGHQNPLQFNT